MDFPELFLTQYARAHTAEVGHPDFSMNNRTRKAQPMYEFERSIFINRTQQEVFDYTFDPANNAKWQSATESSAWTSEGPPGVGARFKIVAKQLGQTREVELEVTRWEPPNGV